MKHIHTFESFINEGSLSKKSGTGEIAVMRSDKAKAEKIMTDMKLDYEDLGPKDSSLMNYYKLPDTTWDILNKIGTKIDLQSMTVLEGLLNEGTANVQKSYWLILNDPNKWAMEQFGHDTSKLSNGEQKEFDHFLELAKKNYKE